jgi:glycerophosphoryl diester phosphodiesterase
MVPLVIAHRGASAEFPEHTFAAYVRALDVGADGVECDVRLTKDGHLVCLHDRTIARTSSGTGAVSTLTLAELQRFDFGSWHGGQPASVLVFNELLALIHDAGRPVRLLVEAKHPTRYAGLVERALIDALGRFGWDNGRSVTVMSFAVRALARVHQLAPDQATVLLLDNVWGGRRTGTLPDGVAIAGPGIGALRRDPGYVDRAHFLGHQVYVWTVDDRRDLDLVVGLGVDAVITNRPAETVAALATPNSP